MTMGTWPWPNQIVRSGAMAITGVTLTMLRYGVHEPLHQ